MCEEIKKEPEEVSEETLSTVEEPETLHSQNEQAQNSGHQAQDLEPTLGSADVQSTNPNLEVFDSQFPGEDSTHLDPQEPQVSVPNPEPRQIMPILILGFLIISISLGFSLSSASNTDGSSEVGSTPALGEIWKGIADDQKDGIAIVKVYGPIQTEDDGNVFSAPKGSDQVISQLKKLGKKDNVKAVVIRVNSPGGTVGASQEIYQEIMKLRKKGKKVVVSMADVCASGGVYISVAADKIMANPGTITGSVGVIISIPNLFDLMEKIGVKVNTVKSGTFKDIGSYSREMSEAEKALLQEAIDSTYEQFLKAVAEGRGLDPAEVRKWADGRIFNGEKALEYKLVDELGSLEDAIDLAQKLAGLEERHIIRPKVNPFDQFQTMFHNWMNPLRSLTENRINSNVPLLVYYPGWTTL